MSSGVNARIAAVNSSVVREIQQTFPPPNGKELWGAPDVTALLIMIGAALERVAKYTLLDHHERQRAAAVNSITAPARTTAVNPAYDEDKTTEPMRRLPDLGDE